MSPLDLDPSPAGDRHPDPPVLGALQQAMGDIVRQIPRLRQRVMQEAGVSVDGASTSLLARLGQDGPLP